MNTFLFHSCLSFPRALLIATLNIFVDIFMNTQISFSFAFYIAFTLLKVQNVCDIECGQSQSKIYIIIGHLSERLT
jgi:hypothetical protein